MCEQSEIWFVKPEELEISENSRDNKIASAYDALNILTELNYFFYDDPQIDKNGNIKKNLNLKFINIK